MKFTFLLCLCVSLAASTVSAETFSFPLVADQVIAGGEATSTETSTADAVMTLITQAGDPSATKIDYEISLSAFDVDGSKTPDLNDDVTAIHLHTVTECASATCVPGDTAGTLHVLNLFGVPREDDADLVVDVANSLVSGSWDPTDANMLTPAPTFDPNDYLDGWANGELFLMVHTRGNPSGAVGGFVVPEPQGLGLTMVGLTFAVGLVRRQQKSQRR